MVKYIILTFMSANIIDVVFLYCKRLVLTFEIHAL